MRVLILSLVVTLCFAGIAASGSVAASDDYETLEFFLDQTLKNTQEPAKRREVLDRYLIRALGLIYKQNQELIRLNQQMLQAIQELHSIEKSESRDLELQMRKLR